MRTQPLRILPQHDERVADIAAVTAAAALARRRPLLTTVHKTDRALAIIAGYRLELIQNAPLVNAAITLHDRRFTVSPC